MDVRHLRYFAAIAEEGSLSGAAARIGIAQPSLSQHVKTLETRLGVALVSRSPRGVTLTAMDSGGPYDRALTERLRALCEAREIPYAMDVFRRYNSDGRAAAGAGADCPMALACFACDGSHAWEQTHGDSLRAIRDLARVYIVS